MTRIAIIGPGALGGVVATCLAQHHALAVTVCARTPFDYLSVQTPDGPISATPHVLVDPGMANPVEWVMVATKAYDVASTQCWLDRLIGPETRLAVLQNGVEHVERFSGMVPTERIVPVVVDIPAARTAAGRMIQHRHGTMHVSMGRDGQDFVDLFAHTKIAVTADPDWRSRAWAKLCLNSAGAVTALTLRSTGPVWSSDLEAIVRAIVEECAAVARAEGAVIDHDVIERVVDGARHAPEGASNSLHADRVAGRPMEIDARNGAIVRFGTRHGIPTPMNALMLTLLKASGNPWVS